MSVPYEFVPSYTFLPIPARTDADDGPPPGHDRYVEDRYSGSIPLAVTAITPWLLLDAAAAGPGAPQQVMTQPDGADQAGLPLLTGGTLKGALRSAFEAITNSRFGVFEEHTAPLAARESANGGAEKKPAVVVQGRNGALHLQIVTSLRATKRLTDSQGNEPGLQHLPAVLVPHRLLKAKAILDWDREEVCAWIRPVLHTKPSKPDRKGNTKILRFMAWRAAEVWPSGGATPPAPVHDPLCCQTCDGGKSSFACLSLGRAPAAPVLVKGRMLATGATFGRKHDERLVVTEILDAAGYAAVDHLTVAIDERIRAMWSGVLDAYRRAEQSNTPLPHGIKARGPYAHAGKSKDWQLEPGRTLHVQLANKTVVGVSPAMIGRRPYPNAPRDLLDEDHRPATSRTALSPADRVFGWVHPADRGAWQGLLRIEPPECTNGVTTSFGKPLLLAPMEQPKPTQYRFYTRPKAKSTGYNAKKGDTLAGWKVYQYDNALPAKYWEPEGDQGQRRSSGRAPSLGPGDQPRYREYLAAPAHQQAAAAHAKDANSKDAPESCLRAAGWVAVDARFETTIHFENLTSGEAGALWWLLTKGAAMLRLGRGKAFGFGRVRIDVGAGTADGDGLGAPTVADGAAIAAAYLAAPQSSVSDGSGELQEMAEEFARSMDPGTTDAVERLLRGVSHPVHAPREQAQPGAETYTWWVNNTRSSGGSAPQLLPANPGDTLRAHSARPAGKSHSPQGTQRGADRTGQGSKAGRGPANGGRRQAQPAAGGRQRGRVKWFSTEKGFGFIEPDGGGGDVFVHISKMKPPGAQPRNGQRVEFDQVPGSQGPKAINVTLVEG